MRGKIIFMIAIFVGGVWAGEKTTEITPAKMAENSRRVEYQIRLDFAKLSALAENFTLSELPFLEKIVTDDVHPFSILALEILIKNPRPQTLPLIRKSVDASRVALQNTALRALVFLRDENAETAVRKNLFATDAQLRTTAILACGELSLTSATNDLQIIMNSAQPLMGIYAAGALLQIGRVDLARTYLENAGRLPRDAQLATTAIRFLGLLNDDGAISYFFERLSSNWRQVAVAAAQNLSRIPAEKIARVLARYPYERATLLQARWQLITYLQPDRKSPFPLAESKLIAQRGNRADISLMLEGWQKNPDGENLPLLISTLQADSENADRAVQILADFIENSPSRFTEAPQKIQSFTAWTKWWFRQHRVLAIADHRALLQLPSGETRVVELDHSLDFSAQVQKIIGGVGVNNLDGAQVEISCANEVYLILP